MGRSRKAKDENQISMVFNERSGQAELVIAPRIPEQAIKTQDQVSNFLTQNFLDAGLKMLEEEKKGRLKKTLRTKVSFSYEGFDIQAKKDFTLFDQEVLDAVVTLYLANNEYISPAMVYRAMTGKTEGEYIHPGKLQDIEESIDKCMYSKLSIDASEAAAAMNYDQAIYSGNLIAAEKAQVKMGGHKIIAYKIITEPLLYRYAKVCKQISAVDIKLLDTPVTKTNDTIVLQGYLLRKIEQMKANSKYERFIKYDDLYSILGTSKEERVRTKRVREYIKDILDFWKENGYISGYDIVMRGRSYNKIMFFI